MSTRAVYTVFDERKKFHVYIHCDGYPTGAAEKIANAIPFAWTLPRFEADDFAAALIAGNKPKGGGLAYITTHHQDHGDLDYRYDIFKPEKPSASQLTVRAYSVHTTYPEEATQEKCIYTGPQEEFAAWAEKYEAQGDDDSLNAGAL